MKKTFALSQEALVKESELRCPIFGYIYNRKLPEYLVTQYFVLNAKILVLTFKCGL